MVTPSIRSLFLAGLGLLIIIALTARAGTEGEEASALGPKGRIAVLSGQVTDVDRHDLKIRHDGREISVQGGVPGRGGSRSFHDYFTEGMFVTVEGVVGNNNEILASRVTPGPYYDTIPYESIPDLKLPVKERQPE